MHSEPTRDIYPIFTINTLCCQKSNIIVLGLHLALAVFISQFIVIPWLSVTAFMGIGIIPRKLTFCPMVVPIQADWYYVFTDFIIKLLEQLVLSG